MIDLGAAVGKANKLVTSRLTDGQIAILNYFNQGLLCTTFLPQDCAAAGCSTPSIGWQLLAGLQNNASTERDCLTED